MKIGVFEEGKVQTLTQLGLTALQARVYLTFLMLGESTAGMIAKNSRVARQEVYRLIDELLNMGLLRKVITKPTKYEPVPLKSCVAFLLNEKRKNLTEIETEIDRLLKTTFDDDKETKTLQMEYGFREMQKNDKWYKSVNMWAGLKTHDLVLNSRRYSQVLLSSDDIDNALRTGTKMRVIIDNPKFGSPLFKKILSLEKYPLYRVKYLPYEPKALFSVRDGKEVYLITKPSQPRGPPYLISNHPCLVELAQKYFDTMWRRAIKFDDYIKKEEKQEDIDKPL